MTNVNKFIEAYTKAGNSTATILNSGSANNDKILMQGFSDDKIYTISIEKVEGSNPETNIITGCDCPNHIYRKNICKHMIKASMLTGYDIKGL